MTKIDHASEEPVVYEAFAHSLSRALTAAGISSPPVPFLRTAIERFTYWELFRYTAELQQPSRKKQWHRIRWSPYAEAFGLIEPETFAASSLYESLRYALAEIDEKALDIDDIKINDSGRIEMFSDGKHVICIEPANVQPSDRSTALRLSKCFEKIRFRENQDALQRAFNKVPGMQRFADRNEPASDRQLFVSEFKSNLVVLSPSNIAWCMREMLEGFGISLKHAQSLEITAHAFGWPSWNHFSAAGMTHEPDHNLYVVHLTDANGQAMEEPMFYTCVWTALANFCRTAADVDERMLLARPQMMAYSENHLHVMTAALMPDGTIPRFPIGPTLVLEKCDEPEKDGLEERILLGIMLYKEGLEAGLRAYFGIGSEPNVRERMQLDHRGFDEENRLEIQHWLFLAKSYHGTLHLLVEDARKKGSARTLGSAACYKANLVKLPAGWTLMSDYRRNEEVTFTGMTDAEAARVMAFAGLSGY